MSTVVKVRRGSGKPDTDKLQKWELGYDKTNKRMYINNNDTIEDIASTKLDIYDLGENQTAGGNLNNFKTPGVYKWNTNPASSVTNKPTSDEGGFKLIVMKNHGDEYLTQIFIHARNGHVYTRSLWSTTSGSTTTWSYSAWGTTLTDVQNTIQTQIYNNVYSNLYGDLSTDLNKDIDAGLILGLGTRISATEDLNTLTTPGKYYYTHTANTFSIKNSPISSGFALYVIKDYDTKRVTQILFNNTTFYHRSCNNSGTWNSPSGGWYKFTQETVSSTSTS